MALRKELELYLYPNKVNTLTSINKKEDFPHAG